MLLYSERTADVKYELVQSFVFFKSNLEGGRAVPDIRYLMTFDALYSTVITLPRDICPSALNVPP